MNRALGLQAQNVEKHWFTVCIYLFSPLLNVLNSLQDLDVLHRDWLLHVLHAQERWIKKMSSNSAWKAKKKTDQKKQKNKQKIKIETKVKTSWKYFSVGFTPCRRTGVHRFLSSVTE